MDDLKLAFGPLNKATECWICLESDIHVRHRHSSTVEGYKYAKRHGIRQLFCHACNMKHAKRSHDRTRILASSSSLHDAQKGDFVAQRHFNHLTVCGAKLKSLKIQFFHDYKDWDRPVDVVVYCGINDIKTTDPADFKKDLVEWIEFIQKLDHTTPEKSSIMF